VHRADILTTFVCRMSRNSISLKLLEPSGLVLACNGITLDNAMFKYALISRLSVKGLCPSIFLNFILCKTNISWDFVVKYEYDSNFITSAKRDKCLHSKCLASTEDSQPYSILT